MEQLNNLIKNGLIIQISNKALDYHELGKMDKKIILSYLQLLETLFDKLMENERSEIILGFKYQ